MPRSHRLRTVFASLLLGVFSLAKPALGLTFEAALQLAAQRPQVASPRQAAQTRLQLDRGIPGRFGNPEATIGLGTGSVETGFRALGFEFQSVLTLPWALQDVGAARSRTARVEREGLAIESVRRLLEQQRSTARAWWSLWSAQQQLQLAQAEQELSQAFATQLAGFEAQGAVLRAEALEATAASAEVSARVLDAEGIVAMEAAALSMHTGTAPLPRPTADGSPPTPALPEPASWPGIIALAGSLPDVQAQEWSARAASLYAEETAANGTSWLTMGVQAQRSSGDQWQFYGLVGLRWSAFDRNQRAHSQAVGAAMLAEGAAAAARQQAQTVLALALHEVEHQRSLERLVREQVVPTSERLVAARELALRQGAGTVFEVLRARTSRFRARVQLVTAEALRRQAEFDAWLLLSSLRSATTSPQATPPS